MDFNPHSNLVGRHAFLGASNYHWTNYDIDKLVNSYKNYLAVQRGTRLHAYAAESIALGQKLPRSNRTLNMYVNDAIGFRMIPEQVLYYSDNAMGTADAISFRKDMLRIHDYKSGITPASMRQLEVYAAFFCLEYGVKPSEIGQELRIYQSDQVVVHEPDPNQIQMIMDKAVYFDKCIEKINLEV